MTTVDYLIGLKGAESRRRTGKVRRPWWFCAGGRNFSISTLQSLIFWHWRIGGHLSMELPKGMPANSQRRSRASATLTRCSMAGWPSDPSNLLPLEDGAERAQTISMAVQKSNSTIYLLCRVTEPELTDWRTDGWRVRSRTLAHLLLWSSVACSSSKSSYSSSPSDCDCGLPWLTDRQMKWMTRNLDQSGRRGEKFRDGERDLIVNWK